MTNATTPTMYEVPALSDIAGGAMATMKAMSAIKPPRPGSLRHTMRDTAAEAVAAQIAKNKSL